MTMIELIEKRKAEFDLEPQTPYGNPNWREWLDEDDAQVFKIPTDPDVEVWTDGEALLISYSNGPEDLKTRDDFCAGVRSINCDNSKIDKIDNSDLWELICAGKVELF